MTRPKTTKKPAKKPAAKAQEPRAQKPPPVMAYDARTAASLKRLAKLGVVKLKPSPDGTAVFVTREGQVALRSNPGRAVRVSRVDLRTLQSLAARECAARRRVRVETAADVEHARDVARATRAATKEKTRADVDAARADRDKKRARQRGACDATRREVAEAKGGKRPRVTPAERARERVQMRDAEIRAEFGHVPGALELYRKSGGAIRFGGARGVERFGQLLHDTPNAARLVADVDESTFASEEAAWYARKKANPKAKLTHQIAWSEWQGGRLRGYAMRRWPSNGSEHMSPAAIIHAHSRRGEDVAPFNVEIWTGKKWQLHAADFATLPEAQAWAQQTYRALDLQHA